MEREEKKMSEKSVTCEIVEPIAVLSENEKGYTKEINLVSWNGAEPKFDSRNWHPGRVRSGKGITLTKEEIMNLMDAMEEVLGDDQEE
jgi:hypothetical protein